MATAYDAIGVHSEPGNQGQLLEPNALRELDSELRWPRLASRQSSRVDRGGIMFVIVVFIAASVVLGQIASYVSKQPIVPQLQHRPGTPTEVVSSCWRSVVSTATEHAKELGAELIRVDATSAGEMRRVGRLESAPIEVGVVYSRGGTQELRQGVIECRVDSRGAVTLASLPGAAR